MPASDRLWLNEDQCPLPSWANLPQHYPEPSISSGKSRLRMPPLQNRKLLSKSQVFQQQFAAGAKEARKENSKEPQQAQHESSFTCEIVDLDAHFIYLIRQQIGILARNKSKF
jgi:hypothetical protein